MNRFHEYGSGLAPERLPAHSLPTWRSAVLTIIFSVAVILIGATAIGLVAKRVGAFDYDDSDFHAPTGHRSEPVAMTVQHRHRSAASV